MCCIWKVAAEDRHCALCAHEPCSERRMGRRLPPDEYVQIMEEVTGTSIRGDHRLSAKVWARNMVAYQLFMDGYDNAQIGKAIGRSRCTIIYAVGKVQDMLEAPVQYPNEMDVWRKFKELLSLRQNT